MIVALLRGNARCVRAGLRMMAKHVAKNSHYQARILLHNIAPSHANSSLQHIITGEDSMVDTYISTDSDTDSAAEDAV